MRWKRLGWRILAFAAATSAAAFGGPKVAVGRAVPAAEQVSMDQIDHRVWDQLLERYVNEEGEVNYNSWKANAVDVQALDGYLAALSRGSRSSTASRAAQLAFWINAYNAVTVKGILREYPTTSIRNHTAKLIGYNIWKDLLLNVGGEPISLDAMEHQVLRKMNEPRIHFAIVCASIGCPRLLNRAYVADQLDAQLTENARAFFAHPRNFVHEAGKFRLSAILDWFGSDFGDRQAGQLKSIAPYLPTQSARDAAVANAVKVSYADYDWNLNEQVTKATKSVSGAPK